MPEQGPLKPDGSTGANGMASFDRMLASLTLVITAALSLLLSANKLMWNDEFLSFYSDSVPTARDVMNVQLHYPISLDPPTYHLLSHFAMEIVGRNAMALRLPALAGFLLMQVALFVLMRRFAGGRAGVIAMLFPLMTASFRYSAEGRPYGLLLGLYASAFTCWYVATQTNEKRWLWLTGLAASLVFAVTSHYFGVLILLPVVFAECARVIERRRLDAGMIAAIVAGFASVGLDLPFQHGLKPYRTHYYISTVSVRATSQGYRELFVRYTTWPMVAQKAIAAVLMILTLLLVSAAWRRFRRRPSDEPRSVWVGVAAFALLPVFGFLFGRFVTHTMEVRYVVATLLAFAIAIGVVLERRLRNTGFYLGLYVFMLAAGVAIAVVNLHSSRMETSSMLSGMAPSDELREALLANPQAKIYTQSTADFFLDSYYANDPVLRGRFALVYDEPREVQWRRHNTNAVAAENLQHFTSLQTVPYDTFRAVPGALLLDYGTAWEWLRNDLEADHVALLPLQPTLRANVFALPENAR